MAKGTSRPALVRQFSAGGAVFRKFKTPNSKPEIRWLIVKPAGKDRWQLPKGLIDKGESSETAAVREVGEEGGVEAKVVKKIGNQELFFFWEGQRIFKIVTFYLMEYIADRPGGHDTEVDEAQFLPLSEAVDTLTFKKDKEILTEAASLV